MADNRQFLKELDKKLWTAADKLRSNLDAAVYKHAVLGLIFPRFKNLPAEHGYVLTPGCTACAEVVEDDSVLFAEKLATLTSEHEDHIAESAKLPKAICKNMKALGLELPVGGKK